MPESLVDLEPTDLAHRWRLPVTVPVSVGQGERMFMFGGIALGAAVLAMERTCDRPALWATAQYLSYARPGSTVDFDVRQPMQGHRISQARVVGHVGDQEIIAAYAALGGRTSRIDDQWVEAPPAPPPADCPLVERWRREEGDLHSRFEQRLVSGRYQGRAVEGGRGAGRVVLWVRRQDSAPIERVALCVIADFVLSAVTDAIGALAGGTSLDNTIRFARAEETEWALCDMSIESVQNGVIHAAMRIFSESGVLLASAAQTAVLRVHSERQG